MNKIIKKILLTGGACAGKTSSITEIKNYYKNKNYKIFVMPEIPTFLINNGITSKEIGNMNFIKLVIGIQIKLIDAYYEMAKNSNASNVLIIFDGGPLDCMKFITKDEFDNIIKRYYNTYQDILNKYDGIIHLETVAKMNPKMYNNETNYARETDPNISIKRDDILIDIYKNHHNRIIIEANDEFHEKIRNVIKACEDIVNR